MKKINHIIIIAMLTIILQPYTGYNNIQSEQGTKIIHTLDRRWVHNKINQLPSENDTALIIIEKNYKKNAELVSTINKYLKFVKKKIQDKIIRYILG